MPLPWNKKSKINRGVSRFVNDILVVQTGFPTSIIDLIVKNRNRLNKSPPNKPRSYSPPPHCVNIQSTQILNSTVVNTVQDYGELDERDDDADKHFSDLEECDESGKEIIVSNDDGEIICDCQDQEISVRKNRVSVVIIKVFLVLILFFGGSIKIAMAMTLLAFLLISVEKLFKLCVSGCKRLMGGKEKLRLILVEESTNAVTDFTNFREEFRDMIKGSSKAMNDFTEELVKDERDFQFSDLDRQVDVSKEGDEHTVLGRRDSAKLKAKKFKKYVAKKLGGESRNRKKNKQDCTIGQCIARLTEVRLINVEAIEEDVDDDEEDDTAESDGSIHAPNLCLDTGVQKNSGRKWNWSWNTFIPVVIVVVGLVGGRTMALVLSLVCILLHKLSGGTKRCEN